MVESHKGHRPICRYRSHFSTVVSLLGFIVCVADTGITFLSFHAKCLLRCETRESRRDLFVYPIQRSLISSILEVNYLNGLLDKHVRTEDFQTMSFRQFGQAGGLAAEGFSQDSGANGERRVFGWWRRRRRRMHQVEETLDDVAEDVVIGRRAFDMTRVRRRPLADHVLVLHKIPFV